MNNTVKQSFLHALGVGVYIVFVSSILTYAEKIFGKMNSVLSGVGFLLLFTTSAVIVGALVLGKPLMLYFDGKKKEAVAMFLWTALWLAILTIVVLTSLMMK